jgi:SAM-dependent methyltransferase
MKSLFYRVLSVKRKLMRMLHESLAQLRGVRSDELRFRCNICGKVCQVRIDQLTREEPTCRCGSTVRLRALMCMLSMEIFDRNLSVTDFPSRPDILGIDMSGAATYAEALANKLSYTNTYFHKSPRLDITDPDPSWWNRCDFVISSDVFEHVAPPVARAFDNTFRLLRPGGVFLLTVPYTKGGLTVEHFPELNDYRLETRNGHRVLANVTRDGRSQEFSDLTFHGGDGETLELRVFSEAGVLNELQRAGFVDVRIHRETVSEFGILWPQDWSLPISARRPSE